MKMSGKKWAFIGAVILIAAVVALYIPYNNQMKEQKSLEQQIMTSQQRVLVLTMNKSNLEKEITKLETDIATAEETSIQKQAELDDMEDQLVLLKAERQQAIAEAIALLNETGAKFLSAAESIEYSELFFTLADIAGITLGDITTSETRTVTIDDVVYSTVSFNLAVAGDRENILAFINEIQSDNAFKTAFFNNIDLTTSIPYTDEEKAALFDTVLDEMVTAGVSQLTTDEIVNFIVLGIKDVTADEIHTRTVEQMATLIKSSLGKLVTDGYKDPLANTLAELVKQHIADALIATVVGPLAQEISDAITDGANETTIAMLFGIDIAELLGPQLSGMLASDIAALLNTYISEAIATRMIEYVEPMVFQSAQASTEILIEQAESASSSSIEITLYTYQEAE